MNRPSRMTADDFLRWHESRPEGDRYQLVRGEVVRLPAERSSNHVKVKFELWLVHRLAIEAASIRCDVHGDGMSVRIDEESSFEPDAVVHCGAQIAGDALEVPLPVIICDVLSPSTEGYDVRDKLDGYFHIPSVRHDLILAADESCIVHHNRQGDGTLETNIVTAGLLTLDPPGISIKLSDVDRPITPPD